MKVGKQLVYADGPVCSCPAPLVGAALIHAPGCPRGEARRRREEEVAALVVSAETGPAAWEALGSRPKTQADRARSARADALADALRERWGRVETGRALVADGKPVTPAVSARFTALHLQRLELLWKLEKCVFPGLVASPSRLAAIADEEVHKILGAHAHGPARWPCDGVQAAMRELNTALALEQDEAVPLWCRKMVEAACACAYGGAE